MVEKELEWCDICATVGKKSKLKIYQINLEEAVKLCEDEACNYPIGLDKLVQRKFEDVPVPQKRKNIHRQSSLHPPIISANLNMCVPRPRPPVITAQAPGNIIRPQPMSAIPRCSIVPPSPSLELFDKFLRSDTVRSPSSDPLSVPLPETISNSNNLQSTDHVPFSCSVNTTNNFNISESQNTFLNPDSEMDIDTSEVTEVIDIHFNTNSSIAFHEVIPKSFHRRSNILSQTFEGFSLNKTSKILADSRATSPHVPDSVCSKIISKSSSPFIPVRSNIGLSETSVTMQEHQKGIKPMVSNQAIDNVISQEIEIETSSNAGSPILGGETTYFVVEGTGKRKGRKPKTKEEKLNYEEKIKDEKFVLKEEKSDKLISEKKAPTLDIYKYFPQWQNEEALCWLDVVLCLFVHSKTVKNIELDNENVHLSHTILVTLFTAYQQACQLVNKYREKVLKDSSSNDVKGSRTRSGKIFSDQEESDSDAVMDSPSSEMMKEFCKFSLNSSSLKTGAGLSCSKDFMSMLSSDDQENYRKAFTILREIREKIWKKMQPRLQCVKGKNDSPVLAIPLMVKDSVYCERKFTVEYDFVFKCHTCGYQQTDRYKRVLPTLPSTQENFTMKEPSFLRACFKCSAENQRRVLKFNRLPGVLMLHFAEGLPHNNLKKLAFSNNGQKYSVTGFVQYRNDPDHFVTWIHRIKDDKWIEFDDLKSPICKFDSKHPEVDSKQIHIVMWEACSRSEMENEGCCNPIEISKVKEEKDLVDQYSSGKIQCMELGSKEKAKSSQFGSKSSHKHILRHESVPGTQLVQNDGIVPLNYIPQNQDETIKVGNEALKNKIQSKAVPKKKTQKKLEDECQSDGINKNALKSMPEKSNIVVAQKTVTEQCNNSEDRKKALAKLWQPKPEVDAKICSLRAQQVENGNAKEVNNTWKPVDKVKLTEKKYRGKLSRVAEKATSFMLKSVGTSIIAENLNPGCKTICLDNTIVSNDAANNCIISAVVSKDSKETKHVNTGKDLNSHSKEQLFGQSGEHPIKVKTISNIASKGQKTNCSNKLSNGHSKILTGSDTKPMTKLDHTTIYSVPIASHNPEGTLDKSVDLPNGKNKKIIGGKGSNLNILSAEFESNKHSKNIPFFAQLKEKFNLLQKMRTVDTKRQLSNTLNKNYIELGKVTNVNRSSSRCSTTSASQLSNSSKSFSGYKPRTFDSYKPASDSRPNLSDSPTLSMKSEIVMRPKRKLSNDSFITIKKPKTWHSTGMAFSSSLAMDSTGNSTMSSPSVNGEIQNKESDILQNLYNALDIPLGSDNRDSLDLPAIESTSCLQDMDDFLDQLL